MSKHTLFSERMRHSFAPTPTASVRFPNEPRLRGGGDSPSPCRPATLRQTHREVIAAYGKGEDS
jgi:hypothetical protein